ncbi:MAG: glycosyltransferase [Bdellovibrionota bacterium]
MDTKDLDRSKNSSHKESKRILYILPQPFFSLRGSSFRAKATLQALVALGFIVDLICFDMGENVAMTGVTLFRLGSFNFIKQISIGPSFSKLFLDCFLFRAANRLVAKNSYSAIHGVEEGGFIAHFLAKKYKIPFIFDMHSCMSEYIKNTKFKYIPFLGRIFQFFERKSFYEAAGVITVGQDHAALVASIYKDVLIHTLHDLPLPIAYDQKAVVKLKSDLKLEGYKTCVYTGNFESYQGIELLLIAWKKLIAKNKTFKLILVGGTPAQVKSYLKMSEKIGIGKNIIFVGNQPQEEVGNYLMLADILVSPRSSGANTPLKIYGYMTCGKPIVATNIRSHTQVLSEKEAYLAAANPEALAQAMAAALSDEPTEQALKNSRIKAAQELAQKYFNPQEFENVLRNAYEFSLSC